MCAVKGRHICEYSFHRKNMVSWIWGMGEMYPKKQNVMLLQRFNNYGWRKKLSQATNQVFIKVYDGSVVGASIGQCPQFYQAIFVPWVSYWSYFKTQWGQLWKAGKHFAFDLSVNITLTPTTSGLSIESETDISPLGSLLRSITIPQSRKAFHFHFQGNTTRVD